MNTNTAENLSKAPEIPVVGRATTHIPDAATLARETKILDMKFEPLTQGENGSDEILPGAKAVPPPVPPEAIRLKVTTNAAPVTTTPQIASKPTRLAVWDRQRVATTSAVATAPDLKVSPAPVPLSAALNYKQFPVTKQSVAPQVSSTPKAVPPPTPADATQRATTVTAGQAPDQATHSPSAGLAQKATTIINSLGKLAEVEQAEKNVRDATQVQPWLERAIKTGPLQEVSPLLDNLSDAKVQAKSLVEAEKQLAIVKEQLDTKAHDPKFHGTPEHKALLHQELVLMNLLAVAKRDQAHEKQLEAALMYRHNEQLLKHATAVVGEKTQIQGTLDSNRDVIAAEARTQSTELVNSLVAQYATKEIPPQRTAALLAAVEKIAQLANLDATRTKNITDSLKNTITEHNHNVLEAANLRKTEDSIGNILGMAVDPIDSRTEKDVLNILQSSGLDTDHLKALTDKVAAKIAASRAVIATPTPTPITPAVAVTSAPQIPGQTIPAIIWDPKAGVIGTPAAATTTTPHAPTLAPAFNSTVSDSVVGQNLAPGAIPKAEESIEDLTNFAENTDGVRAKLRGAFSTVQGWAKSTLTSAKKRLDDALYQPMVQIDLQDIPNTDGVIDTFLNGHPELTLADRQALKVTIAKEVAKNLPISPKELAARLAKALKEQQIRADERSGTKRGPLAAIDRQIRDSQTPVLRDLAQTVSKGLGEAEKNGLTESLQDTELKRALLAIVRTYTAQRDDDVSDLTKTEMLAKVKVQLESSGQAGRYEAFAKDIDALVAKHNVEARVQRAITTIEEELEEELGNAGKNNTHIESTTELPELMVQVRAVPNIRPSTVAYMEARLGRMLAEHNADIVKRDRISTEKKLDKEVSLEKVTTEVILELRKQPLAKTLQTVMDVLTNEGEQVVAKELLALHSQLERIFALAEQNGDKIAVTTVEAILKEIHDTLSIYPEVANMVTDRLVNRLSGHNKKIKLEDDVSPTNIAPTQPVANTTSVPDSIRNSPMNSVRPQTDAILEADPDQALARTIEWVKQLGDTIDAADLQKVEAEIDALLTRAEQNQDTIFPDISDALLKRIEDIVGEHNPAIAQEVAGKVAKRFYLHNQRIQSEIGQEIDPDVAAPKVKLQEVQSNSSPEVPLPRSSLPIFSPDSTASQGSFFSPETVDTTTEATNSAQALEFAAMKILRDGPATAADLQRAAQLFERNNQYITAQKLTHAYSILHDAAESEGEDQVISALDTYEVLRDIDTIEDISDILRQQMKKRAMTIIDQQNQIARRDLAANE